MLHQLSYRTDDSMRIPEHEHHFSFKRLLSETLHFDHQCANAELTAEDHDRLFEHQIWSRNPRLISSDSLYVIDVTTHERLAEEAYFKLLREGYIIEFPVPNVDTTKITSKFRHHFSFLPEYGQKRLACVLVAWKREIARLEHLEREEQDIQRMIADMEGNVSEELEGKLKEVKRLLNLKPSLRDRNDERVFPPDESLHVVVQA